MPELSLIVAMTNDRVIGKDGGIPWSISEDKKLFKSLTTGNTVIMGRKTYESIGKPLPNRTNIVVSKSMAKNPPPNIPENLVIAESLEDAVWKAKVIGKNTFGIGGAKIYEGLMPYAGVIYASMVKGSYDGDTKFPKIDSKKWDKAQETLYKDFTLETYYRINFIRDQDE